MKKKVLIFFLMGIIMVVWFGTIFPALYTTFSQQSDENWKKKTSPIPKDRLHEICVNLSVLDDPLCQNEKSVYAPDFFSIIAKKFDHSEITYQDVQTKIGKYQSELDDLITSKDGSTYFVAAYDLRGDGATSIAFFFDGTYSVNKLTGIEYHYERSGF